MKTNLNFNSTICTSREQSERLLSLGIKKETADMTYFNDEICSAAYNEMECPYDNLVHPAWSLDRLIDMLNNSDTPEDYKVDLYVGLNRYDEIIALIQSLINIGEFNKEYLNG